MAMLLLRSSLLFEKPVAFLTYYEILLMWQKVIRIDMHASLPYMAVLLRKYGIKMSEPPVSWKIKHWTKVNPTSYNILVKLKYSIHA
jgi:hypothetical protein